jgi:hypothetical protein
MLNEDEGFVSNRDVIVAENCKKFEFSAELESWSKNY